MAYDLLTEIAKAPIPTPEHMLGRGAMMPFNGANSGGRKLMFGVNLEQRLSLVDPDVPYLGTGYEYQFGQYSSSHIRADDRYVVVGIIPKYSHKPDYHLFYILQGSNGLDLTVVEAEPYKHITEEYGYRVNTSGMDKLNVGSVIPKGAVMLKSNAFDEYDNRMDGKNLLVRFNACEKTMEDSIRISESCSKKLASPLIHKIKIVINDNDIPLNLYGTPDQYKVFPDVGEEMIVNDLVMGYRREKKEESLFIQSYDRLSQLFISDEKIRCAGRIIDIDVYSNDPSKIQGVYFDQIRFYHEQQIIFAQRLVEVVEPYLTMGGRMKYDLQKLYWKCKGILEGKQYFNERVFSSLNIDITVLEEIPASTGDKLTNRYGGKGVISEVVKDELMPRTYMGEIFDIEINMCGVYGRENGGQLFELTTTSAARKLLNYWGEESIDVGECYNMYLDFLQIVAPSQFEETVLMFDGKSDDVLSEFIGSMLCDGCMHLEIEPMSEMMDIDKVAQIYQRFPWMQQEHIIVPLISSTGKIQYVNSNRPVVAGYIYYYRLKQHAKEKFSVTSLSATNIRNENSRNKASKMYKALYSRTPIRFGVAVTAITVYSVMSASYQVNC